MFTPEAEQQLKDTAQKMAGIIDRICETHAASNQLLPHEALILATAAHLLRNAMPIHLAKAVNAARKQLGTDLKIGDAVKEPS